MSEEALNPVTPFEPVEQVDHRGERSRRLKWSVFTSLLTKPIAFIGPIITVPLFLHYLGKERYGLYETIGALMVWLTLTNAGMSLGLINRLTDCHVSGDRELARKYVSSLMLVLLPTTLIFTLLITLVVPLLNWQHIFPTTDIVGQHETPLAVWVSAMITLWGLFFAFPQPIYTAYQEVHRNNLWDGAAKVLSLAACIVVPFTRFGLVGVIIAAAGLNLLTRIVNGLVLFTYEKPWLMPSPRYFDRNLLYGTIKQGIGLFVISSAAMSIFQVDKLIIGHLLGQDAVAQYSVIGRPFLLMFGLYSLVLGPLWPAFGEALRRGDIDWVKRVLRLTQFFGCFAMLACGAAMFFFGDWILRVWTRGDQIAVSKSLVLALTGLFVLWVWMANLSILLNSAGVLRAQMWFISLHAVLNVLLAVALAKPYGMTGVAWSMSITGAFTSAWGYPWMFRKYILQRNWTPA